MINRVNQTNFGTNFSKPVQEIFKKAADEGRMTAKQFENIEKIAKDGNDHLEIHYKSDWESAGGSMGEDYDLRFLNAEITLEAPSFNKSTPLLNEQLGSSTRQHGSSMDSKAEKNIENFLLNLTSEDIAKIASEKLGGIQTKIQAGLDKLFGK